METGGKRILPGKTQGRNQKIRKLKQRENPSWRKSGNMRNVFEVTRLVRSASGKMRSVRIGSSADMAEEKNRQMIQYHFFATKEQAEQIEKRMRKIGVRNKCAYFRKMAIDGYYICVDLADVKEMVRLLRIYGNNLNQLARRANEGGSIYRNDVEDLQHDMHELWKMMRQILERLSHLN